MEEIVQWTTRCFNGNSFLSTTCKLMLEATVNAIWQDSTTFKARARNEYITNGSTFYVRTRLSTLFGFKPSQENRWF